MPKQRRGYSLLEALAELGRPAVVLGLGGKFSLLVAEMRADDIDLHEGPEALRLPFQVVGRHHWMIKAAAVRGGWTEKKRARLFILLTFHVDLVFSIRLRQNVYTHDHLANCIHASCCKRHTGSGCFCVRVSKMQLRYMTTGSEA